MDKKTMCAVMELMTTRIDQLEKEVCYLKCVEHKWVEIPTFPPFKMVRKVCTICGKKVLEPASKFREYQLSEAKKLVEKLTADINKEALEFCEGRRKDG